MKHLFKIYKEGMTSEPVIIMAVEIGDNLYQNATGTKTYSKEERMEFYRSLGYTVTEL